MYFTATFPYVMMIILLIRGATLKGAYKGIIYYLKPDISRLADPEVWIDAGTQVFFSYSVCVGTLVSFGSFNSYNNNCIKDTFIIACVNSGTSFLAGFAVFSALGFMAEEQGLKIEDVAEKGPGLAFIAYPKEVLLLPFSQLWSCLFFLMLFVLGMSTLMSGALSLMTTVEDLYPLLFRRGKYRKPVIMAAGCIVFFLINLTMVTKGGMYILQLFDFYGASGFTLLWTATWQCVGVAWIYGDEKFYDNLEKMVGYRPGPYYKICWKYLCPLVNIAIFTFSIVKYEPLKYDDKYEYPYWGQLFGWGLACASMVCVPVKMFLSVRGSHGETFMQKLQNATKSKFNKIPGKKQECRSVKQKNDERPPPPSYESSDAEAGL